MNIDDVTFNNRKKVISITVKKGDFSIPYSKLDLKPSIENKIDEIFVDAELGKEAITYILENGEEDSIHLDVFLDYNKDPSYLKNLFLFSLTIAAKKEIKKVKISKNEICRRLHTSPSQLARLLDQTNEKKSVDKMLELLAVLGITVRPEFYTAA